MPRKSLAKFVADTLTKAGWPGVVLDERKQHVQCPKGEILFLKKGEYHLRFISYSSEKKEFNERGGYGEIIFPKNFEIRKLLYFKFNGNFKLSREQQFKNIVNPLGKSVKKIRLSNKTQSLKFYRDGLSLSLNTFTSSMKDAEFVYSRSQSYKNSSQNYLSNIKSRDYSKNVKKQTTYIEKGEFKFLVDRLYLKSKKNRGDFLRYLDNDDIQSTEEFITKLLRLDVLSEDFLRRLNDFFIKERLKDIVDLGRKILSLGSPSLTTLKVKQVITKLGTERINQLETLWQKYFEKNLLYLIFTYKKIFPKIELKTVEGDKKYPDFIGVNHYNGLDVIEIKTHLKKVLVWDNSHQNFYFSPEMSKAIVQTTNYMDAIIKERFKNSEDRQKITNFVNEENLYHPRGIIVISSRGKLTTKVGEAEKLKRDFTKLRNSLHNIEVLTFDEIIDIADEYIKNIAPKVDS